MLKARNSITWRSSFLARSTTPGSTVSASGEPSRGATIDLSGRCARLGAADARTSSSGLPVARSTFSATLPSNQRFRPERPCVAMVIKVSFSAAAVSRMTLSALPFSTRPWTSPPEKLSAILAKYSRRLRVSSSASVSRNKFSAAETLRASSTRSITESNSTGTFKPPAMARAVERTLSAVGEPSNGTRIFPYIAPLPQWDVRSTGAHHEHWIGRMAHHGFGDAAEHPTLHPRAAMGTHGDQAVRRLAAERNDLVAGKPFGAQRGHFFNAEFLNLNHFLREIFVGFVAHAGDQLVIVDRIVTIIARIGVIGNMVGAEQQHLEAELLCHPGHRRQDAFSQL